MAAVKRPLKVAVLSSARGGGAGIAAKRVSDALNSHSDMSTDFIDFEAIGETLPQDAAPQGNMSNRRLTDTHFTVEYPGFVRGWVIELLDGYDVINVHWASYLLGLAELDELSRRGKPMLFTLHDYYYITGGCHYPAGCGRMASGCIGCPQVAHDACESGVVPGNLKIKRRIFSRENVHLAAPSGFLVNQAVNRSGIVPPNRTHILRNAYEPLDVEPVRHRSDATRIVLIADSLAEQRKGMGLALDALVELKTRLAADERASEFVVDVIGKSNETLTQRLSNGSVPHKFHGTISDHSALGELFQQSDYLLTCSYEDNWPNILVESASYACVPVVGPGHGCEEFVKLFDVGQVASEYSAGAFADALQRAVNIDAPTERAQYAQQIKEVHAPSEVSLNYFRAIRQLVGKASAPVSP